MLSRVADSLYWLARYLERAEHTARLLDVNLSLMLDQTPESAERRWERLGTSLAWAAEGSTNAYAITNTLTFDAGNPASIVALIAAARENARQVREQISTEMWEQLNRLSLNVKRATMETMWRGEPHDFFHGVIKDGIHLFQGITDATLSHGEGWQWLCIGRFIERAMATATLLDVHFEPDSLPSHYAQLNYLEWVGLLKSCTSFEAYCNVYTADVRPARVAEFLLLNPDSPRSVRFAAARIQEATEAIANSTRSRHANQVKRLAGRLQAALDYGQVDEIMAAGLRPYLTNIRSQCEQIDAAVYQNYINYPIETALN